MEEIRRDIKGYEGLYKVSNMGNILSMNYLGKGKTHPIKIYINQGGYSYFFLCKDMKSKNVRVHRIVGETFIENIHNKRELNHIDGNKRNNAVSNLEWVTSRENTMHKLYVLNKGRKRPVIKTDLLGNHIISYQSIRQAARDIGIHHTGIKNVLYGKQPTAGGFKWIYDNKVAL